MFRTFEVLSFVALMIFLIWLRLGRRGDRSAGRLRCFNKTGQSETIRWPFGCA